jgi:hypothetical protein
MGVYVSQLALELGVIEPDGLYRLLRDFGQAHGQDPDKYLTAPSPDSLQPKIFAEQAISEILNGRLPAGVPAEGAQAHMERLQQFVNEDSFVNAQTGVEEPSFGLMTPAMITTFRGYMQTVAERVALDARRAKALAAAQQFQQGGGGVGGRPPEGGPGPSTSNPQLSSGNELIDESLPTAGGGGNGQG